jgi:hypothetical protein
MAGARGSVVMEALFQKRVRVVMRLLDSFSIHLIPPAALTSGVCLTFHRNEYQTTNKLRGLSPRANYTDRATAACR